MKCRHFIIKRGTSTGSIAVIQPRSRIVFAFYNVMEYLTLQQNIGRVNKNFSNFLTFFFIYILIFYQILARFSPIFGTLFGHSSNRETINKVSGLLNYCVIGKEQKRRRRRDKDRLEDIIREFNFVLSIPLCLVVRYGMK